LDWSTPGGVIDPGESPLEALQREVIEETGLAVTAWEPQAYGVEVTFVEREMTLTVSCHVAVSWDGQLCVENDPDGIVVDAGFVALDAVEAQLGKGPRWVNEPLTSWLTDRAAGQVFRYEARGTDPYRLDVQRLE